MTELITPTIKTRFDLGMVIEYTTQYGVSGYFFGNDVVFIQPRQTGVYVTLRGNQDEFWIGKCKTEEETKKLAEDLVSIVASIRLRTGVDNYA